VGAGTFTSHQQVVELELQNAKVGMSAGGKKDYSMAGMRSSLAREGLCRFMHREAGHVLRPQRSNTYRCSTLTVCTSKGFSASVAVDMPWK
jgi:hypothetical protein